MSNSNAKRFDIKLWNKLKRQAKIENYTERINEYRKVESNINEKKRYLEILGEESRRKIHYKTARFSVGCQTSRVLQQTNKQNTKQCNCQARNKDPAKARKLQKLKENIIVKQTLKKYECSLNNKVRSVNVKYSGGLLSKQKYRAVRRSLKTENVSTDSPQILSWEELQKFIKDIDRIEPLHFTGVNGARIDIEKALLVLAKMYLNLNSKNIIKLDWFGENEGQFVVAIGCDGAPFGKTDTSSALLISIANSLEVASCAHNYVVMGANCQESDKVLIDYYRDLGSEMQKIEEKTYECPGFNFPINFTFSLVPNDNKMLATLAGELTNAAYFPCTFFNVSKDDICTIDGKIGETWKPWTYSERMNVAKKVEAKKSSMKSENRSNVTKYIASLGSRQEFEPLFGKIILRAVADPLHTKNNSFQLLNSRVFKESLVTTSSAHLKPSTTYSTLIQLSPTCPVAQYFRVLKSKLNAGKLHARMIKWFDEAKSKEASLNVRFTGEDSEKFAKGFCFLLELLLPNEASDSDLFRVCVLMYTGICLRECCSLFSRLHITQADVERLKVVSRLYFNANALFARVNLTVWIVGYAIPYQVEEMFKKYGYGLGLNTMQGREAKHIAIKEYVKHSTVQNRWDSVFQHDWMANIWLKQNHQGKGLARNTKLPTMQNDLNEASVVCLCGLTKPCKICESRIFQLIKESCEVGKINDQLKSLIV